jgi:hypothetical protein
MQVPALLCRDADVRLLVERPGGIKSKSSSSCACKAEKSCGVGREIRKPLQCKRRTENSAGSSGTVLFLLRFSWNSGIPLLDEGKLFVGKGKLGRSLIPIR